CCDIGRHGDETPCTGRGCAGGRDVNDDWNWRSEKALYNFLRRIQQPARRVELNHKALDVLRFRFFDASGNVTRGRRADRAVDVDKTNFSCGKGFRRRCTEQPKEQRDNTIGGPSSTSPCILHAISHATSQSSALHSKLKLLSWGEA